MEKMVAEVHLECFTDASEFAMISLLGPGVILFIFILWLMMPPADYIKLWARVPAETREHSHTGLAEVKERLALMNGPIKLTVMELIEVCFQRNTVAVIHGKVEERKGLAPSLSSSASPLRD
ncbi:hypothetical protein PO909_009672 [Leuciscus waleckii]